MKRNIFYYRKKAVLLQKQIEEARPFLSRHKPSLGFWGEHLLRVFLRMNMPSKVKVGQGFILLGDDKEFSIQNLHDLIRGKIDDREKSKILSPQCDIIVYRGEPLKTFGEVIIVNSKDIIAVIEVKCSISRSQFEATIENFRKLNEMGVRSKYLFIYNSCSLRSIYSYFYPKSINEEVAVSIDVTSLYDHGDKSCLPKAIVGVNKNYCLCQDYVISDRDQFGYVSYKLKNDTEDLSCLQLFLFHLYSDIDSVINGSEGEKFAMNFESMISEFSFGLFDL